MTIHAKLHTCATLMLRGGEKKSKVGKELARVAYAMLMLTSLS